MNSSALIGGKFIKKNPLEDLLSSLNAVISTNESTRIITGHVIYNPAYTYKFQLKTTYIGDLKGTYKIHNMFRFAYSQGFDHIDINKTQIQTDP